MPQAQHHLPVRANNTKKPDRRSPPTKNDVFRHVVFCMMCSAGAECDAHCVRDVSCGRDVRLRRVKGNTSQHCDRRERHHCAAGSTSLARKGKQHKKTGPPLSTNKKASFVCRQKALFCMMYSAARNMMCTTCVMCPTDVMCAPRVKRNSSH